MNQTLSQFITFAVSAGLGLLVGLERERKPGAKAGVRTFTLIAVLGTLAALLTDAAGSAWILMALALAVAATLIAAYANDPRHVAEDSGSTTIVAALTVFALGAANYYGYRVLAVGLGVAGAEQPGHAVDHRHLQDHIGRHADRDQRPVARDDLQVQRHADAQEEQAQQQAAERLDIGLELVAKAGFR